MPFKSSLNNILIDKWGNPLALAEKMPKNALKLSEDKTIVAKIVSEFQDRNRAEIQKWQNALTLAKNPDDPRSYALQDLFDNLESDGHYISETELRKAATLCADFSIIDRQTGDIDVDRTELFREEWFYNFREDMLDFPFKGYTLFELINPQKLEFDVIPRRNVQARFNRVFFEASGNQSLNYSDPAFNFTLVKVGKARKLGIMADLCGQLIWKRNAQQAWAEFTEKYGHPLITATTNKTAQPDLDNIESMLVALGEAARAVLPEGTTIDIKPFTGGDSFNVFDRQIERINTEISKPIVGGTMLTDDGSSRSQSEVHERNLDEKIAARDKLIVEYVTNGQIIPIMQRWGHDINPEIHKFRYDASFELSLKEYWDVVNGALEHFDIPDDWVSKTFNFPIDGRKEPRGGMMFQPTAKGNGKIHAFTGNFR
ncbi:DUF935 family protein [Dysgonomonas sp. 520]|uniref:phage portal protein family protein n=1 Tax=Dysgonomonas sp. 520 TaxID=2302931 RepID=UPI0013D00FE6|nr:DUF935 family protein [Dysgonomonas sp. 520]NDW10940.1 DUF935 family protein [Dysgonomonas sp. 520]